MITSEEIINIFLEIERKAKAAPPKPKPKPKPAAAVAQERWAEKPTEVVARDAAALNKEIAERLRKEREWAAARRDDYQAVLDAHWQSMLDAQREQRAFRMVGGFWEGPHCGNYNPVQRFEDEWRR